MRAVTYVRVSTEQQAKENKGSIDHQINACDKAIKDHGWELVMAPIKDIESGREVKGREAFEALITQLWLGNEIMPEEVPEDMKGFFGLLRSTNNGRPFDVLVVYDYDRLGRDHADSQTICKLLLKRGIQVYSCNQPVEPDDPQNINIYNDQRVFSQTFGALKSAIEIHSTRRRYWQGMGNKVKRGDLPHPSSPPYGYDPKVTDLGNGKSKIEVVITDADAEIVRQIYDRYLENKSYRDIANYLNDRGIPSPSGKLWYYSTVKLVLTNPVYAGLVRWQHKRTFFGKQKKQPASKWVITKGNHPAIIREEIFWQVQSIIDAKSTIKGRASNATALLSGLVKCAHCGSTMWAYNAGDDSHAPPYYVCAKFHAFRKCGNKYIAMELLDSVVIDKFVEIANNKELLSQLIQDQKASESKRVEREVKAVSLQESKNREKLTRLVTAYENGVLDIKMFGERKTKLDTEFKKIAQERERLDTHLMRLRAKDYAFKSIQKIEALKDNLAANKPILRNILLSTVSRVEVLRENVDANRFGVELVFK